jgi:hypothetical protein
MLRELLLAIGIPLLLLLLVVVNTRIAMLRL